MYGINSDVRSNSRGQTDGRVDESGGGGGDDTTPSSTKRAKVNSNYHHTQHAPLLTNQRAFNYEDQQHESLEGGGGYGSLSGSFPGSMGPPTPMGGNPIAPMHGYRTMPPSFLHSQQPPNLQQPFFPHQVSNAPPQPQYYSMPPLYQNMWQQQPQHQQQNMPPPLPPPPKPPPLPPPPKPSQQYSVESSRNRNLSPWQPASLDNTLDYSDEEYYGSSTHQASPMTAPPPIKVVSASTTTTNTVARENEHNQARPSNSQQARRKKPVRSKGFSFNELPLGGGETPPRGHRRNNSEGGETPPRGHRRNNSDGGDTPPRGHRRNNSDLGYQQKRSASESSVLKPTHRRNHSLELRSPLPLHPFHRKTAPTPPSGRHRSSSYGGSSRHRRGDSASSIASMTSILSDRSIVSDISKSALFKDVTEKGMTQFHAPTDNVRLVMNKDLVPGELYKVKVAEDEEERFISYHMQSDENFSEYFFNDEGDEKNTMENLLYPSTYVLQVNDDLYQRVLKEISDSKLPCGLFFCGHHEDVDRPSISIAVVIVVIVFGALLAFTVLHPY